MRGGGEEEEAHPQPKKKEGGGGESLIKDLERKANLLARDTRQARCRVSSVHVVVKCPISLPNPLPVPLGGLGRLRKNSDKRYM